MSIELNKTIIYKGQMVRCVKIRRSGINTFQVVSKDGKDLVIRDQENPGMIADHGIRIITCYPCAGCGKTFTPDGIFSYVDGNNGAITRSSKGYCRDCYKQKYKD